MPVMQSLVMAGLWLAGAALAAALGALLRVALGGDLAPDPVALLRGVHVIAGILWAGPPHAGVLSAAAAA
jgi:hypothetical protein